MFVGSVDLGNGTGLELVITSLKGSTLPGRWDADTNLLMLCIVQNGRCCVCRATDHPSRYSEKLALPNDDANRLAKWLEANFAG